MKLFALTALAFQVALAAPTVEVKQGTIVGVDLPNFDQEIFLGIPYAQPPLGDLRLRKPQAYNSTYDNFDASKYSPLCWNLQSTISDGNDSPQDEDCSLDWYNGTYLVQAGRNFSNDIVFVSINYRLLSLGFLGGKALLDEGNVNLGHQDQRLALSWVHDNIAAFGGDPSRVTIFGESSGGASVWAQVHAYGGNNNGLFRAGIVESIGFLTLRSADYAPYQASFDALLLNSTCANTINSTASEQLQCLRHNVTAHDLITAVQTWATGTMIDGDFLPYGSSTVKAVPAGKVAKVPILVGCNTDEGASFGRKGTNTTDDVRVALQTSYPTMSNDSISTLLELYPDDPYSTYLGTPANTGLWRPASGVQDKRTAVITGDLAMDAMARYIGRQWAKAGRPIYRYRFNQQAYNTTAEGGIAHFSEVRYVFGNPANYTYLGRELGPWPSDHALSGLMMANWLAFAVHLDPNKNNYPGAPNWPDYSQGGKNMVFQSLGSATETDDYREKQIDFIIDEVMPNLGAQ
ncbi:alpha/beta-hydrolase [Atractiella rhizophila]|nr:alpha/beta-hydrolase [Atractiella rhizophila]